MLAAALSRRVWSRRTSISGPSYPRRHWPCRTCPFPVRPGNRLWPRSNRPPKRAPTGSVPMSARWSRVTSATGARRSTWWRRTHQCSSRASGDTPASSTAKGCADWASPKGSPIRWAAGGAGTKAVASTAGPTRPQRRSRHAYDRLRRTTWPQPSAPRSSVMRAGASPRST